MANEVVITTYKAGSVVDGLASGVYGAPVGGEVLDIAEVSSALTGEVCRLQAVGAAFWVKLGASDSVSAASATAGNFYLADGAVFDFEVTPLSKYIDTAAA